MRFNKFLFSYLFLLISYVSANAQSLAEAYKDYWYTGCSVNQWEVKAEVNAKNEHDVTGFISADQTGNWPLIQSTFNTVVAENCMKAEVVHPSEGVYDFTLADQFVEKALASGMRVHGHVLIWHSQCPAWFHRDENGNLVSKEVLRKRMKEHITTIVAHFKGRVHSWDVVNEGFEDDGSFRKSLFYHILGEDYIPLAFQYAHEADPSAELYYNDFSMNKKTKIDGVCNFFKSLLDKGIPVHGIGMQGHMILEDKATLIDEYDYSINRVASIGIPTFFSEVDLSVLPNPYGFSGANVSDNFKYTPDKDPFKSGLTKEKEAEINKFWVDWYKMLIKNKGKIIRVNFWCANDANSWRNDFPIKGRTDYATLVGRDGKLKPVVRDIINLVAPSSPKKSK